MSAINPASFASPSLGLQAPSGIGPGAVSATRQPQPDRRPQQESSSYPGIMQGGRPYQSGQLGAFGGLHDRSSLSPTVFQQPNFGYAYSPFGGAPRGPSVSLASYPSNMLPQMDTFTSYAPPPEFQPLPGRFPSPHSVGLVSESGEFSRQNNGHPVGNDGWMTSFQGLSLNSR